MVRMVASLLKGLYMYSAADFYESIISGAIGTGKITAEDAEEKTMEELAAILAPSFGKAPRLFINIEGGLVQAVVADVPVEVVKIDYDTEGSGPDDGVVKFPQSDENGGDGGTADAFVDLFGCDVDAKEVARVFAFAEEKERQS